MGPELVATYVTSGFAPIAFYLMYKMANSTIRENTAAIRELKDSISTLNGGGRRK